MPTKVQPVNTKHLNEFYKGVIRNNKHNQKFMNKLFKTVHQKHVSAARKAGNRNMKSLGELERRQVYLENKLRALTSPKKKGGCFGGRKKCTTRVTPFSIM